MADANADGSFKTADILRPPVSPTGAGKPSAGVPPTNTAVAGLSAQLVVVDLPGLYDATARNGDQYFLREGERQFSFLDIPAAGGGAAGTLLGVDWIMYEGKVWQIVRFQNDLGVGLSTARATLWVR